MSKHNWLLGQRLSGPTGRLYIFRIMILGLQTISMLILALLLERDSFGRFAFLWAVTLVLTAFISMGAHLFLLRALSARQGNENTGVTPRQALTLSVVVPLILSLSLWGCYISAHHYDIPYLTTLLPSEMFATLAAALSINFLFHVANGYRVFGNTGSAMLLQDGLPQMILIFVAVVLNSKGNASATDVLFGFVIGSVISTIASVSFLIRSKPVRTLFVANSKSRQRFQTWFWASSLLSTIALNFDIVLGGFLVEASSLGDYQILRRFANLLSLPLLIANWSVAVDIGKAYAAGSNKTLGELAQKGNRLILLPALIMLAFIVAASPAVFWIYSVAFNGQSVLIFLILVCAAISNLAFGLNFMFASQCHLEQHGAVARLLGVIIGCALIALIATPIEASWLAYAALAAQLSMNFYIWFAVLRALGVNSFILNTRTNLPKQESVQ